jgi:class 3 adenylate cyclase
MSFLKPFQPIRGWRFVSAMNLERRKRNRQLTVDYLCAASGGPALYLGQDMKTAHAGLGISASEWEIAMDHVQRVILKLKVIGDGLLAIFPVSPKGEGAACNAALSAVRAARDGMARLDRERLNMNLPPLLFGVGFI